MNGRKPPPLCPGIPRAQLTRFHGSKAEAAPKWGHRPKRLPGRLRQVLNLCCATIKNVSPRRWSGSRGKGLRSLPNWWHPRWPSPFHGVVPYPASNKAGAFSIPRLRLCLPRAFLPALAFHVLDWFQQSLAWLIDKRQNTQQADSAFPIPMKSHSFFHTNLALSRNETLICTRRALPPQESLVLDRFPYDENIACRADGEGVPANPEVPSQICWDPWPTCGVCGTVLGWGRLLRA